MSKQKPTDHLLSFMYAIFDFYRKKGHSSDKAKHLAYTEMFHVFLDFIKKEKSLKEYTLHIFARFFIKCLNEIGKIHASQLKKAADEKNVNQIEIVRKKMNEIKDTKDQLEHFLKFYEPEKHID
jgi:hypothetical protein